MFDSKRLLVLVAVLAAGLASTPRYATAATGFAVGDDAPNFELPDQSGVIRTLFDDFLGGDELVVLDFCAMWCGPCQQATTEIQAVTTLLASEGIDVHYVQLLVQNPSGGPADLNDAVSWATTLGNTEPVLTGPETEVQFAGYAGELGVGAFPTFAFVGPDGIISELAAGYTQDIVLESAYHWDSTLNGFPTAAALLDLEIAVESASSAVTLSPGGVGDPLSGTLPDMLFAAWNSNGMSGLRRENWNLSVFGLAPLPKDLPLSVVLGPVDWPDGPGGPDPGRDFDRVLFQAEAELRVFDENFNAAGNVTIPLSLVASTLTMITPALADVLEQPGFPPETTDVYGFEILDIEIKAIPVPEPAFGLGSIAGLLALLLVRGRTVDRAGFRLVDRA